MPSMSSEVGKIYVCLCQGLDSGRALFPASDSFMRIRFRASDFAGRKKQSSFVQMEKGFLCEIGRGDGARAIRCLFARVTQQLDFGT